MRTTLAATAALLAAAALAGCGIAHLNPAQGESYRKAFAVQQATPSAEPRPPTPGLDTQEADVVARSYLASLSGKSKVEAPEPMLLVAPPQRAQATPLPPSVPKN